MAPIAQDFLDKLNERQKKFALTAAGYKFLFSFLWNWGLHLYILGTTGSGKTQKGYWLVDWMRHTRETIIWLDSGKNQEIVPLLKMGTPVRVICPKGCDVEFTEWNQAEKKYVRMDPHPEVIQVPDAGSAWWAVKKRYINIFAFRNAFENNTERLYWMAYLFETLAEWLRRGRFPKILPFSLYGDEFQWVNAGESVTSDTNRAQVSEGISENAFEIRGYGGRLVIFSQLYKNIPPATRKNLPAVLLNRDSIVEAGENPALAKFNAHVPYYRPWEGLFVYEDKKPYPATSPWKFPYYVMPKIKVKYIGEFDNPTKEIISMNEVEQEMIPDMNKYQALADNLKGYEVPANINRYEAIDNDSA